MKRFSISSVLPMLLSLFGIVTAGTFPEGIVYGPKAAFQIAAPEGWVVDNQSGLPQGLPCVLYLKKSSWKESPVIMYAKIASPEFKDSKAFALWAANEYSKQDPNFSYKEISSGFTGDKHPFFINEIYGDPHGNIERTAYIQLPNAVGYIVLSARDKETYSIHREALNNVLESFTYAPQFIGYTPMK